MLRAFRVELKPNNVQRSLLFQAAGTARWAYNWGLAQSRAHRLDTGSFLWDGPLRQQLTQLKKTAEFAWLRQYSNNIPKQALRDMSTALKNWSQHRAEEPAFKSRRKTVPSFYHDPGKLKVFGDHVQLEKIGRIRLKEHHYIPVGVSYLNPRISCLNGRWYLSVAVEMIETATQEVPFSEPIGIDLGIKTLAVVSDGQVFKNINKTRKIQRLEKKRRRLQRRASRLYPKPQKRNEVKIRWKKSRNLAQLEKQISAVSKRIKDQHINHIHQMTHALVKTKPEYIVIEDLNVSGMLKNRHLAKAIQDNRLREVRRQLEYKSQRYGISLIVADRFFPSSKLCSACGHKKSDLKLSDRVYRCTACGQTMDRDLNAAINLKHYPRQSTSE